jgi:hypothetical protein
LTGAEMHPGRKIRHFRIGRQRIAAILLNQLPDRRTNVHSLAIAAAEGFFSGDGGRKRLRARIEAMPTIRTAP